LTACTALVDPFGIFFSSATGKPVDGVAVTLIDTATGNPAAVFGDDGISTFPASLVSGGSVTDSSGRLYRFPPGGYRYPLVNAGTYRFMITPPAAYSAPSTIADAALQSLPGGPFSLVTPGSRLEPFSINPGPSLHIDIPLDPITSALWLQKSAARDTVAVGDFLPYQLDLKNSGTVAGETGVVITDTLPPGFRYRKNSTRLNGLAAPDPAISADGRTLAFAVGNLPAKSTASIRYVVEVAVGARNGTAINRAIARSAAGSASNQATAAVRVRSDFMNSRSFIMGQVFVGPCGETHEENAVGIAGIRIFLEDGTFAVSDKNGMYHFEGIIPGSHVVQMDLFSVPQKYEVLACEENSRFAGSAYSQFVDLQGGTLWRANFHLGLKPPAVGSAVEPDVPNHTGAVPAITAAPTVGKPFDTETVKTATAGREMPDYSSAWLAAAQPGMAWLWPPEGHHPAIPTMKLSVQYDPRTTFTLFLNGTALEPLYLDATVRREDNTLAVSTWRGLHLADGDNLFEAVQYDTSGVETARLKRVIHYSTPPVSAGFIPSLSKLTADGTTPPVIAVRLTDRDGHPARQGIIAEYALDPPYVARQRSVGLMNVSPADRLTCRVGEDGIALIELQPTTKTGEAVVRFKLISGSQELRARLKPEYRDWILVGLGEGTVGYNAVAGHMENLRDSGQDERLYEDGRIAFFAKGRIKGEWLITMAYDTAKGKGEQKNASLFQTIDPDTYYTLYGDGAGQQYDAASSSKLYLKIERDDFYALFGDFTTGLTYTELSRYSRSLTGFKSEYRGKDIEFNLFGSETGQAFIRDELRGDGTSGLYRLTRRNMIINSEKITIETRDRFHSENIIESRILSRYIDYSIDTDAGTLFFKEPVRPRDDRFNPVYIVAEYEVINSGGESLTYGGRAGAKLLGGSLLTGFSYVHEGQGAGQGNLYGLDAVYKIDPRTSIRLEAAHSDTESGAAAQKGNAYLAELQHDSAGLTAKFYFREQEEGFGLGQQKGSEYGTRKMGGDAAFLLSERFGLSGQAYRQYNLSTGGVQDVVDARTTYTSGLYSSFLGLRYARDRLGDGTEKTSQQLIMGGSWLTLNKRLTLMASRDQAIGGNSVADFPTRTILGADFKVTPKVVVLARQEITGGTGADSYTTSAGVKAVPWEGGALHTTVGQDLNENSERVFALFGLKQTWKVTEKWSVDSGLDRSQTVRNRSNYQFNVNVPPASGENRDFTAVSLGNSYKEQKWNWNTRLEARTSDQENKWGLFTAYVGEPKEGWGWSARCQVFETRASGGISRSSGDLRLGLVYRPLHTRWIFLDRLDFLVDRQRGGGATSLPGISGTSTDTDSRRIVNNLNINYKPDTKLQISFQYGAKYAMETIDSLNYSGYTDLFGIEGRYDLTKVWDVGVRGSVLHSWSARQFIYSAGPSVGVNVVKNVWISIGYNVTGFADKDFSAADYTAQGPFVRFRFKFDQNSVKEAANWVN
jgi:uncharacterized repeat protein (TIGR01451 family)